MIYPSCMNFFCTFYYYSSKLSVSLPFHRKKKFPTQKTHTTKNIFLIYIILRYITKENKKMHVTYAFVYYFLLIVMFKTFMTVLFCIPQVRRFFFSFVTKHKLADSQYVKGILYLAFAIILIIMADSIMTYVSVRGTMNNGILFT
jgi:hypothetical protein